MWHSWAGWEGWGYPTRCGLWASQEQGWGDAGGLLCLQRSSGAIHPGVCVCVVCVCVCSARVCASVCEYVWVCVVYMYLGSQTRKASHMTVHYVHTRVLSCMICGSLYTVWHTVKLNMKQSCSLCYFHSTNCTVCLRILCLKWYVEGKAHDYAHITPKNYVPLYLTPYM